MFGSSPPKGQCSSSLSCPFTSLHDWPLSSALAVSMCRTVQPATMNSDSPKTRSQSNPSSPSGICCCDGKQTDSSLSLPLSSHSNPSWCPHLSGSDLLPTVSLASIPPKIHYTVRSGVSASSATEHRAALLWVSPRFSVDDHTSPPSLHTPHF